MESELQRVRAVLDGSQIALAAEGAKSSALAATNANLVLALKKAQEELGAATAEADRQRLELGSLRSAMMLSRDVTSGGRYFMDTADWLSAVMALHVGSGVGGLSPLVDTMSDDPLFFRAPRNEAHGRTLSVAINCLVRECWVQARDMMRGSHADVAHAFFNQDRIGAAGDGGVAGAAAPAGVAEALASAAFGGAGAGAGAGAGGSVPTKRGLSPAELPASPTFLSAWRQVIQAMFETGFDWAGAVRTYVLPTWADEMMRYRVFGAAVTAEGEAAAPASAEALLAKVADPATPLGARFTAFAAQCVRLCAWVHASGSEIGLAVAVVQVVPAAALPFVDDAVEAGSVGTMHGHVLVPTLAPYDKDAHVPLNYDTGNVRRTDLAVAPTGPVVIPVRTVGEGGLYAGPWKHAVSKAGFRVAVLPTHDPIPGGGQ